MSFTVIGPRTQLSIAFFESGTVDENIIETREHQYPSILIFSIWILSGRQIGKLCFIYFVLRGVKKYRYCIDSQIDKFWIISGHAKISGCGSFCDAFIPMTAR